MSDKRPNVFLQSAKSSATKSEDDKNAKDEWDWVDDGAKKVEKKSDIKESIKADRKDSDDVKAEELKRKRQENETLKEDRLVKSSVLPSSLPSKSSRTFGSGFSATGSTFSTLAASEPSSSIFSSNATVKDEKLPKKENETIFGAKAEGVSEKVDVSTGEENDIIIFKARAQLKIYQQDLKEWKQRGVGPLHVNVFTLDEGLTVKSRIVMRNSGTLGLLLNIPLFKEMNIKRAGEKTVLFTALEEGKVISYAVILENKNQADDAFNAINSCKDPGKAGQFYAMFQEGDTSGFVYYEQNFPETANYDEDSTPEDEQDS